jgi:4-hydroxyphenylpyruvate dioxygenase
MPLHGIDHLELWVGNAAQASFFFRNAYGFSEVAYAGLETGLRDRVSHVLEQGGIRLVLTGTLRAGTEIAEHHARHGDGVKVIALAVPDVDQAYREATARGARGLSEPHDLTDEHGKVRIADVATYGETVHRFVDRSGYDGPFLPGYGASEISADRGGISFTGIDHVVGNVELGKMNEWVKYYEDVFGMTQIIHFTDEAISTEYSALMSKVVTNGDGRVKFPINEPAEGRKKSQIEEFLEYYDGPGVQHIAIATDDIVRTVRALRANGVELLDTPGAYYDQLESRVGRIEEATPVLRELGILVDRDDVGYMLQIFTKPVETRPTLFFEIIQRKGGLSFGKGNFKALFVAIEREQERRGTL